ncbi:MAG: hypothetical protein QNJ14_04755 [Woeseiaceae bacterium]|nr:hypothetical protein [Woeseiaceae bacterium]
MFLPTRASRAMTCLCVLALSASVNAQQRPTLPEPRVKPKTPTSYTPPKQEVHVPGTVRVPINTQRRAKFDIRTEKLHDIVLGKPSMRGNVLRANDLTIKVVIVNGGTDTFAFAGNQIDASIIEGHFDYRQRTTIDRRRVPYYPARAMFDVVVRANSSIELPLVIRGQKTQRIGYWPVPTPVRPAPGLRGVRLETGNARLQLRPEVWYTIDARLKPAKDDEVDDRHAVFINVRFDRNGGVTEMQGPSYS